jgi:hypothetical protein
MDVLLLSAVIGVGSALAASKGGARVKGAIAWSARQAGFVSGKVAAALRESAAVARAEYEKAREAAAEGPEPVVLAPAPVMASERVRAHEN